MTKKDITDTTQLPPELNFAIAASGAVTAQEKLGQVEVENSAQLPIKGLLGDRARWEALGVKIRDDVKSDDPLFCRVDLPPGWRKVPRGHDYWTDLVDAEGVVRAEIFYKAAFYDRRADVRLTDPPPAAEAPACVCADCGHEQATMAPCGECRSVRVVLQSVVRDLFGEDWRGAFKDDPEEAP